MDLLLEAKRGNRVFRITFPDAKQISFRLLPWKHFKTYSELLNRATVPNDMIEDAIFRQCVLDSEIKQEVYEMRAGVVSTLVGIVMTLSGPSSSEDFNNVMTLARQNIQSLESQVAMTICTAFPAYKMEDIQSMTWDKVAILLAQAEAVLIATGRSKEPIRALTEKELQESTKKEDGKVNATELVKDAQGLYSPDLLGLAEAPEDLKKKALLQYEVNQRREAATKRQAYLRQRGRGR